MSPAPAGSICSKTDAPARVLVVLRSSIQAAQKNALAVLLRFCCSEGARGHLFTRVPLARRLDCLSGQKCIPRNVAVLRQ